MEDKRIVKTKANLKNTMKEMISQMPFDRIRVTELCARACTSRITFYTYYDDKYALLNAIFEDMYEDMKQIYASLQKMDNPDHQREGSLRNLMKSMIHLHADNPWLFRRLNVEENMDLSLSYYVYVLDRLEEFETKYQIDGERSYSRRQLSAFLTLGFWGFYTMSVKEGRTPEEQADGAMELVEELIASPLLDKGNPGKNPAERRSDSRKPQGMDGD